MTKTATMHNCKISQQFIQYKCFQCPQWRCIQQRRSL